MSAPLHSKPCDLGDGFSVEFAFVGGRLDAEWSPAIPGPARKHLLAPYIAARNAFLADVGRRHGISIAVVDVGGEVTR
jgi:hypothetical protein